MQRQRESGRNASNLGWHVLRNSRSITHGNAVLVYILRVEVSESIQWAAHHFINQMAMTGNVKGSIRS